MMVYPFWLLRVSLYSLMGIFHKKHVAFLSIFTAENPLFCPIFSLQHKFYPFSDDFYYGQPMFFWKFRLSAIRILNFSQKVFPWERIDFRNAPILKWPVEEWKRGFRLRTGEARYKFRFGIFWKTFSWGDDPCGASVWVYNVLFNLDLLMLSNEKRLIRSFHHRKKVTVSTSTPLFDGDTQFCRTTSRHSCSSFQQ